MRGRFGVGVGSLGYEPLGYGMQRSHLDKFIKIDNFLRQRMHRMVCANRSQSKSAISDYLPLERRHSSYRPDIDGLRMLAIVPVVLYHAGVELVPGGFVGVDIFLVISGFLIVGIIDRELRSGTFSLLDFYERRARRILPAYFLVIAITTVASVFVLLPPDLERYAGSVLATLAFVSNIFFWHQSGYFQPDAEFFPLLHTWSLSVEEQFYFFIPLVMLCFKSRRWLQMITSIAVITLISFTLSAFLTDRYAAMAFYFTPIRAWELGIGALLALLLTRIQVPRAIREALGVIGLALMIYAILSFDGLTAFPGIAALVPALGAAAMIVAGSGVGISYASRLLSFGPFVFIGLISYSLYLWHWPILALMRIRLTSSDLPTDWIAFALVASFTLAIFSWRYVERPFRQNSINAFSRAGVFQLASAATGTFAALAVAILTLQGIPQRFNNAVLTAAAGAEDRNLRRRSCFGQSPSQGLCRFGADRGPDAPVDFILWGDSHADALMPGVDFAARERGLVGLFVGHTACPPVLGMVRTNPRSGSPTSSGRRCTNFNRTVLTFLEQNDVGSTVILAARWALSVEGSRSLAEDPRNVVVLATEGMPAPMPSVAGSGNYPIVNAALTHTIEQLRRSGRDVVLLGGVPEIDWHVPNTLLRNLVWNDPITPVSKAAVEKRNAGAKRILTEASKTEGVSYFEIIPRLCQDYCQVELGGRPLYFDDDHLSTFGSRKIVGELFLTEVWPVAENRVHVEHSFPVLSAD